MFRAGSRPCRSRREDYARANRSVVARITSNIDRGAAVAFVADDDELGVGYAPWRATTALSRGPLMSSCPLIITTGMPAKPVGVAQQRAVVEERGVAPVVRDEPGEAEAEARIVDSGGRVRGRAPWRRACPPTRTTPRRPARGSQGPGPAAGGHRRRQGRRHARVGGTASRNCSHCSGNTRPIARVTHSTSARDVPTTLARTISLTRSGWASAYASAKRRAPRSSPQQPPLDAEVLTQPLHVGDQVGRRVRREVDDGFGGVRRAASALALVELDDQVALGIEHPPCP